MSTTYTPLLGFALPVTGELSGTWGEVVNDSITQLVEDAIAGTSTADVTSSDWTLTTTGSGAVNQARSAILIPTGTPGTTRNIIAPSVSKAYVIINQSDAAVVVKGSVTTGVSIPSGFSGIVAWDGSDFILAGNVGTVTSVAGTGTVNGISLSGTVTSSGNLTLGGALSGVSLTSQVTGTLPVANGGTGVTTSTGTGNVVLSTSPTLTTPNLGTPSAATLTNATGLPIVNGTTGTLTAARGGTGQTTYTDGQLLIGNSTGNTLSKANLTAGTGIQITNGAGSITIANTNTSSGTVTSVGGTGTVNGISLSGTVTSSGNLVLGGALTGVDLTSQVTGTLPTTNGGTGNTAGTVAKVATTNFSIEESGGKLIFKYGGTTIASMSSTGVITSLSNVVSNDTP